VRVSSVTGQVRIAITDTVSECLLLKVIAVICRQLPLVAFEPAERNRIDLEEGLRSGEFDLAVVLVSNLSTAPDIRRENLLKSTRQLWTSLDHPLAREKSVALRSLAKTLTRESARAELGAWRCPRGPTGNDLSGLRFLARHRPLYQPGTRGAVQSTRPLSQGASATSSQNGVCSKTPTT